jgi:serine/threonine protein kinase
LFAIKILNRSEFL